MDLLCGGAMGRIHSYESFGTVDGPGVRFIIFFQGCPMRCQYCHNPDTWDIHGGKEISVSEVVREVMKYKNYIQKGGVTITGGEPLLQMDFLLELLSELKRKGIHTCVDTSGILFDENRKDTYLELLQVVDLFLLDIKHINSEVHKKLTGFKNSNVLAFARFLDEQQKPVWIRHVLVDGFTNHPEDLYATRDFLKTLHNVKKVEVLPYHAMGQIKYEKMGLDYPLKHVNAPSKEDIQRAREILEGEV